MRSEPAERHAAGRANYVIDGLERPLGLHGRRKFDTDHAFARREATPWLYNDPSIQNISARGHDLAIEGYFNWFSWHLNLHRTKAAGIVSHHALPDNRHMHAVLIAAAIGCVSLLYATAGQAGVVMSSASFELADFFVATAPSRVHLTGGSDFPIDYRNEILQLR